ncbi:hypothetical protein AeRB84_004192 [Aphanomyces euteiches]|nr:hypothetical protein AeRB84_004192 [Aphanomyces euteiches]
MAMAKSSIAYILNQPTFRLKRVRIHGLAKSTFVPNMPSDSGFAGSMEGLRRVRSKDARTNPSPVACAGATAVANDVPLLTVPRQLSALAFVGLMVEGNGVSLGDAIDQATSDSATTARDMVNLQ